jgi:serine/threonine-protein kinase RsbW
MVNKIKIKSLVRNICEVEYFLNTIFKDFQFSRKIYCKIYLATIEAVNNAIIHGNQCDASKTVTITFKIDEDRYIVSIKDEGPGFDFTSVSDPRSSKNIYKETGRGIFIMKQYSDKVKFNKEGTLVKLIFNK